MNAAADVPLTDLMIRAESGLERKLCGLAIFQPKTIAELTADFTPEIDQAAIAFFMKFKKRRAEIMQATHDQALDIVMPCCGPDDFFNRFWPMVSANEINTYTGAQEILTEIIAARTARKAIRWVEQSGLLEKEAVNYA